MNKIVPTLFALSQKEFNLKLENLSFSKRVHVDFMDGKFTNKASVSFEDMENLKNLQEVALEVHLMAYEPLKYISFVRKYKFDKVYIHFEVFETDSDLQYEISEFKEKGIKVGLVLNPGTEIFEVLPYLDMIDSVMLMSVWPGAEGQKFIERTYDRLKELRNGGYKGELCVDGGVNENNILDIKKNGADVFFVGSYISSNKYSQKVYDKLNSIIN